MITDGPFVRACLQGMAQITGRSAQPKGTAHTGWMDSLRRLFSLKEQLKPGSEGIYGAFRPSWCDEASADLLSSPADRILARLGADARSGNDPEMLEAELHRALDPGDR